MLASARSRAVVHPADGTARAAFASSDNPTRAAHVFRSSVAVTVRYIRLSPAQYRAVFYQAAAFRQRMTWEETNDGADLRNTLGQREEREVMEESTNDVASSVSLGGNAHLALSQEEQKPPARRTRLAPPCASSLCSTLASHARGRQASQVSRQGSPRVGLPCRRSSVAGPLATRRVSPNLCDSSSSSLGISSYLGLHARWTFSMY